MSSVAGNEAVIARECVVSDAGRAWVPFISGNAIRHRMVREPGMLWLIDKYGLEEKLTLGALNFLLHGGNLVASDGRENTKRIAEMNKTWPLLRLLGASLPDQILAGSMDVWRGTLVCEENRNVIDISLEGRLFPAAQFVIDYCYTRGDARRSATGTFKLPEQNNKSNLMVFTGQAVQVGAMWTHGFILKHVSDLELGALLWSLRLWQATGSTLGGQASRGHGRLRCEIVNPEFEQTSLCQAYIDYALSVKTEAVAWLRDALHETK
jgi:hypothetical protein